jgi:DNA-binding response OmpR family regulator
MTDHADRRRILIAEDNPSLLKILTMRFQDDYEVRGVSTGVELEEELGRGRYDLVISDIHLPERLGTSVIRRADNVWIGARQVQGVGPAIVLITGAATEDPEIERAGRLPNVRALFRKPLDLDALQSRVNELLNGAATTAAVSGPRCRATTHLHKVLVLDDTESATTVLDWLEQTGCEVRACTTAEEARELVRGGRFKVLVINEFADCGLAAEFVAELKQTAQNACPAIVVMGDVTSAFHVDHKTDAIVPNPVRPQDLVAGVRSCLARRTGLSVPATAPAVA